MIVLDASAVLELLLRRPAGDTLRERVSARDETLHAPHLLDIEVTQVLRRYYLAGHLSAERGREALEDLADLDVRRYPHDVFLSRVWELRSSVTAYDAVYLALAEVLGAPLVTLDRRLASARGHRARIELVR
ncbi:MAG: type II toxin-antitoxin system VapC family toxin [Candidatus Rokubacteria bacterium]|nr:type II toxin-antitoxin system VapC family toxin [Candidatus Rokubacteria bacterium]